MAARAPPASVFIRGANSNQNIVLVDGVRIGSSTLGTANWSALPLSSIDHIEIVYGPLSTMYGADAIGGVIQIFTKKGDGAALLFGASAGYGSDNTRQAEAQCFRRHRRLQQLQLLAGAGKEKSDGYSASKLGASSFTYNLTKTATTRKTSAARSASRWHKGHQVGLAFMNSKLDAQYDSGLGYDARSNQKLENISRVHEQRIPA